MMIFNGINIFPSEIELCLLKHPEVKDSAVTGIQHKVHGDIPTAVISLRENSKATKESLEQFIKNKLTTKVAINIILTDSLLEMRGASYQSQDFKNGLSTINTNKKCTMLTNSTFLTQSMA